MKKLLSLLLLFLVSCSSEESDVIKFSTDLKVNRSDVDVSVVLSKYGDKIYSRVKIHLGTGYNTFDDMKHICDLELFFYDKNETKLDFGRFYFQDCDITSLGDFKLIDMNEHVLESTISREYEDEIFGFQKIKYIVIEYKTNDRYEKTEKIKKSFF